MYSPQIQLAAAKIRYNPDDGEDYKVSNSHLDGEVAVEPLSTYFDMHGRMMVVSCQLEEDQVLTGR